MSYIVVGAYTGKVYANDVDHYIADRWARGYGETLPQLEPGEEWSSDPSKRSGLIIRRKEEQ